MGVEVGHPVLAPKLVATAKWDGVKGGQNAFVDKTVLGGLTMQFAQDLSYSDYAGRPAPRGSYYNRPMSVGKSEADLKPKMEYLLRAFAAKEETGMAKRLFTEFLKPQRQVTLWTDPDFDRAAANHENINDFCRAAWGGPSASGGIPPAPGKKRIHQALEAVNWDASKLLIPIEDLGVPAFNRGSYVGWRGATGDWVNGLKLMVDGVQYVYVILTYYNTYWHSYARRHNLINQKKYNINLKFIFYDVFGLDDQDLIKLGAEEEIEDHEDKFAMTKQMEGITAWWQLQHQYGYAPLVTRFVVEKSYSAVIG
jgi:hypothetical protein